jgi:predicted PurR-regulated permease PerM
VLVVAVLLAIGLASIGLLAVLVIALIRHVKLLASSLRRFQDEVQPLLEQIQRGSETAQDALQRMQDRRERGSVAPEDVRNRGSLDHPSS